MQEHQTMGVNVARITENSAMSFGVAVILAGGVFWLSVMYAKVDSSVVRLDIIEEKQEATDREIIDRLARIEEKLKQFDRRN